MVGFPCVGSRLRTWFLTTFVLKLMARQTNRDGLQVFEAPSGFPDTSKYSFCPLGAAEGRQSIFVSFRQGCIAVHFVSLF